MPWYGLDENGVKRIINEKLKNDPDLFYYISNPYIEKLTNIIIEGVAEAIEKNNKKLIDDMTRELKRR